MIADLVQAIIDQAARDLAGADQPTRLDALAWVGYLAARDYVAPVPFSAACLAVGRQPAHVRRFLLGCQRR